MPMTKEEFTKTVRSQCFFDEMDDGQLRMNYGAYAGLSEIFHPGVETTVAVARDDKGQITGITVGSKMNMQPKPQQN
jgi:hypothetical protein